jgi:hypothetical protein
MFISKLISGFIKYLNDSQRSEVEMYSTLRHLTLRRLNMKVTIDGQSIEVEPGTTILQAARMEK